MEIAARLNSLKKYIFFEFLHIAGRVFILVRHSEHVILGKRSLTTEERENGIVLVFNSGMNFQWDEYGITATLVFGNTPQKCFIPADDIAAVWSSELNAQFIVLPQDGGMPDFKAGSSMGSLIKAEAPHELPGNVIKVDFTKRPKKHDSSDGTD
ncbi:MAG: hypothetical protein ABSB95_12265 [Dissulfurispiraceae bacterium]